MREISYAEAVAEALSEAMEKDPRVCMLGGYFFGLSPRRFLMDEIKDKFGSSRVQDTPISEIGIAGLGVGAAMAGLRPIVDIATASFIFQAWPQVVNEAAVAFYMSAGQTRVPVIFHILHGLRGGGAAQHSHSPQSMLWNAPGLQIMLPSSPADAKGLLNTAVHNDNPTVFVDHSLLFEIRGPVPDGDFRIPFGQGEVKRKGGDVTIVATSYMVQRSLIVAEKLAGQGIQVEVVDPRTLVPLDKGIILASVAKTGRVVVVDECNRSCGIAAEISAIIAEEGFGSLKKPIKRVTRADVPVPFSAVLENAIAPTEDKIEAAVRSLVS